MIELKNVKKIYNPNKGNEKVALDDISFKLPSKGLFFILGKSGCGKSTLLNILGLLDKPNDGEALINGKSTTKLKEREVTSYRSNHIGFIFQEFNLLDELNVYENIDLALNLKSINNTKDIIDNILEQVGLKGLEKRNVGELSGGEKGRVAIARALVKEPTIILADEPTGNLDEANSKIIFDILKDISKDHLVVVVSHDKESAKKYALGIIEMKDGKIVDNTIKLSRSNKEEDLEFKKSHINFFKRMKLSFGFLKRKKIRLVFTSLIISIAFALFGYSMSLLSFDIPKMHADTMVHEKEDNITISKERSSYIGNSLFDKNIEEIEKKLNSKYATVNEVEDINLIDFDYEYSLLDLDKAYYNIRNFDNAEFLTYNSDDLKELDIIGSIPTKSKEILISELLADYIVEKGAFTYEKDTYANSKALKVNSKEELIGKSIYVGWEYFYISGIVKDSKLNKFETLKSESANKMHHEPSKLYKEFESIYSETFYDFIVNENFFDITDFGKDYNLRQEMFKIVADYKNERHYSIFGKLGFDSQINCYDGKNILKTNKINSGEVIISYMTLNELFRDEYNKLFHEELNRIKNNGDEYDDDKVTIKVVMEVLKRYNIIGDTITYEITDEYEFTDNSKINTVNLKIVGINLSDPCDYFNDDLSDYIVPKNLVKKIQVIETDEAKLEQLFRDFPSDGKYLATTRFSNKINDIESVVDSIDKIAKYIALGFMIFAIIILTLFITNSTSVNGKKIGILRALGAKISDIIKIFLLEGVVIGFITFILANIITIVGINSTNLFITKEMYFYVKPLIFDFKTILMILLIVIVTITISLIVPIIKLAMSRPIELINKK